MAAAAPTGAAWEAPAAASAAGLAATVAATGAAAEGGDTVETVALAAAAEADMALAEPTVEREATGGVREATEVVQRAGRNRRSPCQTCKSRSFPAAHLGQARHRRTNRQKHSLGSADSCSDKRCQTTRPGRWCRLGPGSAGVARTVARCRLGPGWGLAGDHRPGVASGSAGDLDLHSTPSPQHRHKPQSARTLTGSRRQYWNRSMPQPTRARRLSPERRRRLASASACPPRGYSAATSQEASHK